MPRNVWDETYVGEMVNIPFAPSGDWGYKGGGHSAVNRAKSNAWVFIFSPQKLKVD
jgi:hypothetical protein